MDQDEETRAEFKTALFKLFPDVDELAIERLLSGEALLDHHKGQRLDCPLDKVLAVLIRAREFSRVYKINFRPNADETKLLDRVGLGLKKPPSKGS